MTTQLPATPARPPAAPARLPMTPARWLTLVLGVPVLLAIIGWTGFSAVDQLGSASFPVSYTFPAIAHGPVSAQIESGNITLRQAAVSRAELTGTAHYSLFRAIFTPSGNTVRYHCPLVLGNCELNGTLQVPMRSTVSLSTGGGDVSVQDFTGDVTLNTGGGNLTAGTVTGRLDLDTGGGDVNVAALTGPPATMVTGGGNLTIKALATSGTTTVQSYGGDVSLTLSQPGNVTVTSYGGNVTLVLPRARDARYDIQPNAGGGNVNGLDSVPAPASSSHQYTIKVNSYGGDITFSAAS